MIFRKELKKDVKRKFRRRRVISKGIDDIWSADLADMSDFGVKENEGFRYVLMVIDVFSKFGWAVPLKNKRGATVLEGLKAIEEKSGRTPRKLWTDIGAEFDNALIKENFDWYTTFSSIKASIVERWIRTIKNRLNIRLKGRKWIDVMQKVVDSYNLRKHSTVGMSPLQASREENEEEVKINSFRRVKKNKPPKFKVGDVVRIPQLKWRFTKGYKHNWTQEVFVVNEIQFSHPMVFHLKDGRGNKILGGFYEQELQKSRQKMKDVDVTKPKKRLTAQKGLELMVTE